MNTTGGIPLDRPVRGVSIPLSFANVPLPANRNAPMAANLVQALLVHEFGHALGLVHQWQRFDRDRWIRSFPGGGPVQAGGRFVMLNTGGRVRPFDYRSTMSFFVGGGANRFADLAGNLVTWQAAGSPPGPSVGDLSEVHLRYFRQERQGWSLPQSLDYSPRGVGALAPGPPVPWLFGRGEAAPAYNSLVGAVAARRRPDGTLRAAPFGMPSVSSMSSGSTDFACWGSDGALYYRRSFSFLQTQSQTFAQWTVVADGAWLAGSPPSLVVDGTLLWIAFARAQDGALVTSFLSPQAQGPGVWSAPRLAATRFGLPVRCGLDQRTGGGPNGGDRFLPPCMVTTQSGGVDAIVVDDGGLLRAVRLRGPGELRIPSVRSAEQPSAVEAPGRGVWICVVQVRFHGPFFVRRRVASVYAVGSDDTEPMLLLEVGLPPNLVGPVTVGVNGHMEPVLFGTDQNGLVRYWEESSGIDWLCVGGQTVVGEGVALALNRDSS
ncbi:MAG: hypothetical protein KC766_16735, partial [Myxococcales bacterium]|nr:hypothetical protein [Myxococcales bacterium]